MFQNYLNAAFRNIHKNRLFSFINVVGLAIGFAAALIISLFIRGELDSNKSIPDRDQIYVVSKVNFEEGVNTGQSYATPGKLYAHVKNDFPEFEAVSRTGSYKRIVGSANGESFFEEVTHVDADFPSLFQIEFLAGGTPSLNDASTILIDEKKARKYFGRTDVAGEELTLDNDKTYKVGGVFKSFAANSYLADTAIIVPIDEEEQANWPLLVKHWGANQWRLFVKARPSTNMPDLQDRFSEILKQHVPSYRSWAKSPAEYMTLLPVSLAEINFHSAVPSLPNPNVQRTVSFSIIASVVLMIAVINFVNLSVALSTGRALEVAVRKVVGAKRRHIMTQFLLESVLTALIGLTLGLALTEASLPWFNGLMDSSYALNLAGEPFLIFGTLVLGVVIGILGGLYPAFIVSGYRPGLVLKSNKSSKNARPLLRQALVVLQFTAAIVLIVSTTVIYKQTDYALKADLGYKNDGQLILSGFDHAAVASKSDLLRDRMAAIPGVLAAARSLNVPGEGIVNQDTIHFSVGTEEERSLNISNFNADPEFFDAYDIKLLAGRHLDRNRPTDDRRAVRQAVRDGAALSLNVIIDAQAANVMGFSRPEDAVGQTLRFNNINAEVVGVMNKMNFRSARTDAALGIVFYYSQGNAQRMTLKIARENFTATVAEINRVWAEIMPDVPIQQTYLDDRLEQMYAREQQQGQLFLAFSTLAVFVAALGLFALASYTAIQRSREIGVRKVMGASVRDVVVLLVWQFTKPILIATLIAWPIAWFFMASWLESYSYRIDLSVVPFAATSALVLIVAWATIAGHALKVARANPIGALRNE